jgi:hypothetical protein
LNLETPIKIAALIAVVANAGAERGHHLELEPSAEAAEPGTMTWTPCTKATDVAGNPVSGRRRWRTLPRTSSAARDF